MTKKDRVVLAPVRANAGIEREYQRKLDALIDEMANSLMYWITAAYRSNEQKFIAQDASTAATLEQIVKILARRWDKRFAKAAEEWSRQYADKAQERADASLRSALKKAGVTVEFKITNRIQEILTATVNENVSLIKTISSEHLADVQQLVMRSVQAGRDLGTLRQGLQDRYGITKRRARLIARQSNNNATAAVLNARYRELDITEAQWVHSNAGKEPRNEHEHWNGKTYKIAKGMYSTVSKKQVWPGTDFNCRCTSRAIVKTSVQANHLKHRR